MTSGPHSRLVTLLDLERHAEARDLARTLLAEEPDSARLHGQLSRALVGLEDYRGALESANRAVGLDPTSAWAHRLCGIALLRLGEPGEAARAMREAVRQAPEDPINHEVLAQVLVDVPGQMWPAWQAALHTVHLAPDDAGAHFTVGYVAGRRSDVTTAVRAYRQALAIDPEHATALHNLTLIESRSSLRRRADGLAGALRLEPQRREFRAGADDWADRVLRRAWAGSALALLVAVVTGWGGVAGLVLLALWWRRLMRSVPVGMRRHLRHRVPRSPYLLVVALLAALTTLGALVATVAPRGSTVTGVVVLLLLLPTALVVLWSVVRWVVRGT